MPATSAIPTQTVIEDQFITPDLWNGEFQNIFNLMTPSGIDTYSDTDAKMQLSTNPYPGSVTSHAVSLAGELERMRYQLALLINGGTDYWYKLPTSNVNSLNNIVVPVGGVIDFPSASAPNANWHLCDGTALSRTAYPTLFIYLSTTFGIGDGTTTFNIPDYRDRFSIGAGTSYGVGTTGGEATHVLTTAEMPVHNHVASSVVTDPAHQHSRSTLASISVDNTGSTRVDVYGSPATDPGSKTDAQSTGITVASTTNPEGSGGAHNNIPPYLAMHKMIRIL